jgi:hypothetical protein
MLGHYIRCVCLKLVEPIATSATTTSANALLAVALPTSASDRPILLAWVSFYNNSC